MKDLNYILSKKLKFTQFFVLEMIVIVSFAIVPLFINLPYRINIFLAWEGAYRLYLGQIPYKDFGLPLGFSFWIIPALFFKIFGPYLFTLVKAQVFINIVSGITFSNILKNVGVKPAHKFLSVLVFTLSFSFVNFWPWYNHTVFFYQLLSLNFLIITLFSDQKKRYYYFYIFLSSFFLFLSIFTKQDGGLLAFLVNFFLILYYSIINRNYKLSLIYWSTFLFVGFIIIFPLTFYDFSYWFNSGQSPHSSRIFLTDFLQDIFKHSVWIKFYFLLIILLLISKYNNFKDFVTKQRKVVFFLLTTGILVQAILIQVTSYIPHNVNMYFHSFALAFVFTHIDIKNKLSFPYLFIPLTILVFFWWSSDYWGYGERILKRTAPEFFVTDAAQRGISKSTWMVTQDTAKVSREDWITIDMPSFNKILMPKSTAEGINRLKSLEIWEKDPKVLNMTELTPLAYELNFELEKGTDIPLWYHKGVSLFDREIEMYCERISKKHYDIILFETIPYLNNFYPEEVRECLRIHYQQADKFLAPRHIQNSYIEVYIKKEP